MFQFFEKVNKEQEKNGKFPTVKGSQIFLYYYFNKIIKEPGTRFQSPVLSQKPVRNACYTAL